MILEDEEVNKFLPWYPIKNLEETRKFYEERYLTKYAQPQAYAISLNDNNYSIGYIEVDIEQPYDFGYALHKEFWHRGIASEAGKAVVEQVKKTNCFISLPHMTEIIREAEM